MDGEAKRADYILDLMSTKPSSAWDEPLDWLSLDDDVWNRELTNIDLEGGRGGATPIILDWQSEDRTLLVEWELNDPEKPSNWTRTKKWVVTVTACCLTIVSASTSGIIANGYPGMTADLHSSEEENALTLSTYALGYGIAPLVLSSFSEEYGRRPMYIITSVIFTLFYLPIGLAKNIQTVIIARFIQGAAGSTGTTVVGGTIADIWDARERGHAMSFFSFAPLFFTGASRVSMGWVQETLGWRWIEWISMCISAVLTIWLIAYGGQETRESILLMRRAKRLRKETDLLLTEPIVLCISLWIGFAWGVLYGLIQSMDLVFGTLYGFNEGEIGLVSLAICAGSVIGFSANFYQESLYRKHVARVGDEARLFSACAAGITFVIGSMIYAWTSHKYIHWIAPSIGIMIIIASIFAIFLSVFNYIADTYSKYASSALAGQSLVRNLAATAFPLFTNQVYIKLGFNWASALFGLIAAVLAPVPIVLFFYGPQIRARSHFAKGLATAAAEKTETS